MAKCLQYADATDLADTSTLWVKGPGAEYSVRSGSQVLMAGRLTCGSISLADIKHSPVAQLTRS